MTDAAVPAERKARRIRTRSFDHAEEELKKGAEEGPDEKGNVPLGQFRLSVETVAQLRRRGMTHLFPIQAKTFDLVMNGKDVIGRARTGCGKTLAFVLPIVERLRADGAPKRTHGRLPRVVVLTPTRELAKQVSSEFTQCAPSLDTCCVYGGAAFQPQEAALRRGLDVVVGTPGRIIDHLQRGTLQLQNCKFFVLDEADRMLDMGCVPCALVPLLPALTRNCCVAAASKRTWRRSCSPRCLRMAPPQLAPPLLAPTAP